MYPSLKPQKKKAASVWLSVTYLLLFIPMVFLYAWSIQMLWGWFVAPVFHLSELNLAQAYGLSLLLNLVINSASEADWVARDEMDPDEKILIGYANSAAMPLLALLLGWIVHFWV